MAKVSVIVPCYNVTPWLARCMDCLVNQTLRDIEIICIDDKSTDSTAAHIAEYAARDSRVRAIYFDTNRGVAAARNAGLDVATGEYIGFVDPDDFIDIDFYEKLYNLAVAQNTDITIGNVLITDANTNATWRDDEMINSFASDYRLFRTRFWAAIYRAPMLNDHKIRFPVGVITAQDVVFLNDVILHANNAAVCYDTYYHYFYQRPGSLDSQFMTHTKAQSKNRAMCLILDSIIKADISPENRRFMILNRLFKYLMYDLNTKTFEEDSDRHQRFDMLAKLVREYDGGDFLMQHMRSDVARYIIKNDYDGWRHYIDTFTTRFYLLGFIPILSRSEYHDKIKWRLFGCITIMKIKERRKWFLFGFIPVFKLRFTNPR